MIVAVFLVLQLAPFAFLALAFRPHPNGASVGGARYTEWPERDQAHPEYA